jgi:hypothetical protein
MGLDLTGFGSIFDFGSKIIEKIWPDPAQRDAAKLELFKAQQAGEFKEMEQAFELAKKQIEVNAVEAANPSIFVSGWRPAVGWVCVSAYAYNYVAMPLIAWGAKWYDAAAPAMITLDTGELTTLLFGMLGIGALRTVEKTFLIFSTLNTL